MTSTEITSKYSNTGISTPVTFLITTIVITKATNKAQASQPDLSYFGIPFNLILNLCANISVLIIRVFIGEIHLQNILSKNNATIKLAPNIPSHNIGVPFGIMKINNPKNRIRIALICSRIILVLQPNV